MTTTESSHHQHPSRIFIKGGTRPIWECPVCHPRVDKKGSEDYARFVLDQESQVFKDALARAEARHERSVSRPCACGRVGCYEIYDPADNVVHGGYGPAGCPL